VRTEGDPKVLAPAARAALNESGFEQPIAEVRSMEERIAELNGKPRLNSVLAVIFSGIALILAAVGIYGVISYSTAQRSQEIGVRMALGASAGGIVGWIMRQALLLAGTGVILGLAGHFVLSRVLGSLLYGISPNDASTLAISIAVLSLICILASYIPARRAVKGDPMDALRAE
jgi:putative ABC transport system permease protein